VSFDVADEMRGRDGERPHDHKGAHCKKKQTVPNNQPMLPTDTCDIHRQFGNQPMLHKDG
jgi:hypothetical protein